MLQVGRISLAASGVVLGGLMLGAALASYASPVPIAPQPAPWEGVLHPPIHVGESSGYYSSPPEEVNIPDGYAPAIAFTTLRWWPSDLRMPRDAGYVPPPEPARAAPQYVPDTALDTYPDVQVPHYAAIEQSTQSAQDAAQQAEQAAPEAPADAGGAKVIHVADQLAQAG